MGCVLAGVTPLRGKLWIFICKYFWSWHKTFPSLPLLQLANHSSWYFQLFFSFTPGLSPCHSPPQLICLLCRFQFQFYRGGTFHICYHVTMLAAGAGLSVLCLLVFTDSDNQGSHLLCPPPWSILIRYSSPLSLSPCNLAKLNRPFQYSSRTPPGSSWTPPGEGNLRKLVLVPILLFKGMKGGNVRSGTKHSIIKYFHETWNIFTFRNIENDLWLETKTVNCWFNKLVLFSTTHYHYSLQVIIFTSSRLSVLTEIIGKLSF